MYNKDKDFRQRRNFAPVQVGQELDVKIEAVGEKGDGIAKVKGFVIFVPNVKAGDEVKIKITKVLRKVGFGEVIGNSNTDKSESEEESEDSGYEESESEEESSDDVDYSEQENSEEFGEDENS